MFAQQNKILIDFINKKSATTTLNFTENTQYCSFLCTAY